jgi:hypothetical protein
MIESGSYLTVPEADREQTKNYFLIIQKTVDMERGMGY